MKLAISNIGWSEAEDDTIAARLVAAGADALEIAPGRVGWRSAQPPAGADVAALWQGRGLPIVSMQSLLYGVTGAALFGSADELDRLMEALDGVIGFAGSVGCGPLVFGSPANRRKGDLSLAEAITRAAPVFARLGDRAAEAGSTLCIEANATFYGCDFVTNLAEASAMVEAVAHPAVGMMIDTGNMELAGDRVEDIAHHMPRIRHFHLSVPQMVAVTAEARFARACLDAALGAGYDGVVTIEMRGTADDPAGAAARAVETVRGWIDG
jgi:D-psicose/D-tagatose/L-ribulose 3-epimerase